MAKGDRTLELRFAEEMGRFFGSGGVPRMAGRLWAYLLIVDAPHVSAQQLAEALGASAGSISGATRFLVEFGLIDRIRVPGDRRDYFAPRPGAVAEMIRRRLERLTAVELLISEALERFGDREHARPRIDEVHDVYHWYAREFPKLHERFLAEQADLAKEGAKSA
jgi:DNA-binding transcriptional regulator GbsR (MarR family)